MVFTETPLAGAFILDVEERRDSRGLFARTYCRKEFEDHGLDGSLVQGNLSFNHRKGTLRGMHFQYPPAAETKLVRCTRGAILDVIVDLRPESPTFLQHTSVELTADNRRSFFVPSQVRARISGAGGRAPRSRTSPGPTTRRSTRAACRTTIRGWRSRGRSPPPTCRTATAAGRRSMQSNRRFARGWRRAARTGTGA